MPSKSNHPSLSTPFTIEMAGSQFPFGEHREQEGGGLEGRRRVLVRKRVYYRTGRVRRVFEDKLGVLKTLCHRNVINIRSIQEIEEEGYTIYYDYVPFVLEKAFEAISRETFKELHRQVIQLAIHLAKNYLLTSFSPSRCGVLFVEGQPLIKYFLPLHEITLTEDITALERSVQLFKVQALHLLNTMRHPVPADIHSTSSEVASQRVIPSLPNIKQSVILQRKDRRLSNSTQKVRKYSHYNDILSEIKRKKSQDSTHYTGRRISQLKDTLKTIKRRSERKRTYLKSKERVRIRVDLLKIRSRRALKAFRSVKQQLLNYVTLSRLLTLCNEL